jgi:hypothetical protein
MAQGAAPAVQLTAPGGWSAWAGTARGRYTSDLSAAPPRLTSLPLRVDCERHSPYSDYCILN